MYLHTYVYINVVWGDADTFLRSAHARDVRLTHAYNRFFCIYVYMVLYIYRYICARPLHAVWGRSYGLLMGEEGS